MGENRNESGLSLEVLQRLEQRNAELAKQQLFLRSVLEITSELLGKTDVNEIVWLVTKKLISQYDLEDCVIYVVRDGYCHQVSAIGDKNPIDHVIANPIRIPVGKGIVGSVAETGIAEIVSDTSSDARYIVDDKVRKSELCVPIFFNGEVIGLIDSESSQRDFYNQQHLNAITNIANLIGFAINNAIQLEKEREVHNFYRSEYERFAALKEGFACPYICVDEDEVITDWSDAMAQATKINSSEALGKTLERVNAISNRVWVRGIDKLDSQEKGLSFHIETEDEINDIRMKSVPFQLSGKMNYFYYNV